jgi:hypothetical protein
LTGAALTLAKVLQLNIAARAAETHFPFFTKIPPRSSFTAGNQQ